MPGAVNEDVGRHIVAPRWVVIKSERMGLAWTPVRDGSLLRAQRLLRPEHAVAGVAQARQDVAVIVQTLVDGGGPDRHVGMLPLELRDAFGCGEQADEADVAGAARFQERRAGAELPVASIGSIRTAV